VMHETFKLLVKTVKLSGGTLTDQGSRREIFESFCDEESTLQLTSLRLTCFKSGKISFLSWRIQLAVAFERQDIAEVTHLLEQVEPV